MNQSNPSYFRSERSRCIIAQIWTALPRMVYYLKSKFNPHITCTHSTSQDPMQQTWQCNRLIQLSLSSHITSSTPTHIPVLRSELSMAFHLGVIIQTITIDCDPDPGSSTPIPRTLLACGMRFPLKPSTGLSSGSFSSHALAICLSNQNILFVFAYAAILAASSATILASTSSLHTNTFSSLPSWTPSAQPRGLVHSTHTRPLP